MRVLRFVAPDGAVHWGEPLAGDRAGVLGGSLADGFRRTGRAERIARLLAPAAGGIHGIGCNYRRLAATLGKPLPEYPVVYYSLPNALGAPDDPVVLPAEPPGARTKYEGELVAVIGRGGRDLGRTAALAAIAGYTIGNDLTCNDWTGEAVGGQWATGKGFDGFKPCGPCLVTADEIPDPQSLTIVTELNGVEVQRESCADMVHDVAACVAFLSRGHTLRPGDLVFTGTPFGLPGQVPGARWLEPGDTVRVRIDPLGELVTRFVAGP